MLSLLSHHATKQNSIQLNYLLAYYFYVTYRFHLPLSTAQLLRPRSNWRQRNLVDGLSAAVGTGSVIRCHLINTSLWLIIIIISRVGFNVHQTHYRSYQGRFLRVRWPNQQCQALKDNSLSVHYYHPHRYRCLTADAKGSEIPSLMSLLVSEEMVSSSGCL